MKTIFRKKIILSLMLFFMTLTSLGQAISNYTFSATSGSYSSLTGSTFPTLSAADDGFVNSIPIGFDFWYMGSKYTNIGISSNGFISFNTITNSTVNNSLSANGQRPILAPLWDDLSAFTTNSNISYKLSGAAPSRTFTVEFNNMRWRYDAVGAVIDFQVTLYESTGVVQFDYLQEATAYNSGSLGASIGITATATGANNYMSLSDSGASPTASVVAETSGIASKPANNQRYSFTPTAVSAPSAFTATAASSSQINLAWTDNSAAEVGYVLYYSTNSAVPLDETSSTAITLAANSTSYNLTGLNCGTIYYFKIFAFRESLTNAATANATTSSSSAPGTQANTINFSSVGASSMTVGWTRGNGSSCVVYVNTTNSFSAPSDGTSPSVSTTYSSGQQCVFDGTGTSVSVLGLSPSTTYFVRIYESNCAGASRIYLTSTGASNPNSQTTTAGTTYTVGATGTYSTIQAAYNACTAADVFFIDIQSDYNFAGETLPISLGALTNKSASNTVTIRPQTGVVSLSMATSTGIAIFSFSGGDFVTIDGRAGGSGSGIWTLTNSGTVSNRRVFYFSGGSTFNTLRNLTILGSNPSTSGANSTGGGLIYLFTGQNNNNTLTFCNIGSTGGNSPAWMIVSYTAAGSANTNFTISNNNFYDFSAKAIYIETSTAAATWSITGNSFYQSASRTLTTNLYCIDINSGSGYTVTGNFIGGQAASCGGSAFTLSNSAFTFYCIAFNTSSGTVNTINSNTFRNISITSTSASTVFEVLDIEGTASYTIGTSGNGNTIGATSGTGSIAIIDNGTSTNGFLIFDISNTGTNSIAYNTFGSITLTGTNIASATSIINVNASSPTTVAYNTVGNSTANNITMLDDNELIAIFFTSGVSQDGASVTNNTVQNLSQTTGAGTDRELIGIEIAQCYDFTVRNNIINDLNSTSTHVYGTQGIRFACSFTSSTAAVIRNNTIYNLNNTSSSGIPHVTGILIDGYLVGVHKNKIYNLTSTRASAYLQGIEVAHAAGTSYFYNNIIIISNGANTNDVYIYGIKTSGACSHVIYHNTIKISGSESSSIYDDAALSISNSSGTVLVRNNIAQNIRTATNQEHYAIEFTNSGTTLTENFNYYEGSTASKLNKHGATEVTFAAWNTLTGAVNNRNSTISISSQGVVAAATVSDVRTTGTNLSATVSDDYDGNLRATTPWMGAFESSVALPISLITFKVEKENDKNVISWQTSSEKHNDYFTIEHTYDGEIFETIGEINGAGTSYELLDYKHYHYDFSNTLNYYRLKQTDFDGEFTFSDLISVDNRNIIPQEKYIVNRYNLSGQEVNEFYHGLIIVLYSDGSSEKIIM
jgi:hypothetical protein